MAEDVKAGKPSFEVEVPTAKHAWPVLFVVFFLCMIIAGTWMVIPAIKEYFQATYGNGGMAAFGDLMQFVSYGAFIGAIVAAPLAQKASIKVAFIVAALFAIAGAIVCGLATPAQIATPSNLDAFKVGRALLGVSVGLAAVNSTTALGVWFPVKTRGTAMSIWAVWVPVGMLIFQNAAKPIIEGLGGVKASEAGTASSFAFNQLFFVFAALLVVALILLIIVYRAPREGEVSASARKKIPLREALPYLAKPVLIPVAITWLVFNAVNQVVTTYIVVFFKSGVEVSAGVHLAPEVAVLLGSIASAAGIAAIIFGFISDRLQVPKKYILIVISSASLFLAMLVGFKPVMFGEGIGLVQFVAYLIFMFIGNAGLVACVRPYVPLLVGKGGAVAIGYALAGVTLLQYIGQMFSTPFGAIVDSFGGPGLTAAISNATIKNGVMMKIIPGQAPVPIPNEDLALQATAFADASWILVAIAAVGLVAAFFLRIKPAKADQSAKREA